MRLNQFLAACGLGSRRDCEEWIAAGRVRVNDAPAHFGMRIGPGDRVTLDGRAVESRATGTVWMLHKPAGVLCAARDPAGRPTVLDVVRRAGVTGRVFTVGRLDFDTTGLLLVTDDGDLAFRLMHPSHGVEKEYVARITAPLSATALVHLRSGIELDDGPTAPCRAEQTPVAGGALVRLVLHEGRKRQVRRMLAALGAPVVTLHRERVGPLVLGDLVAGAVRPLTAGEVAALRRAADAQPAPRAANG
jgi:23S rRNA pseudouridine2605 synthase